MFAAISAIPVRNFKWFAEAAPFGRNMVVSPNKTGKLANVSRAKCLKIDKFI